MSSLLSPDIDEGQYFTFFGVHVRDAATYSAIIWAILFGITVYGRYKENQEYCDLIVGIILIIPPPLFAIYADKAEVPWAYIPYGLFTVKE
ncbi:hypothetical protein FO519_008695 [Halicephalobus sp. NKZ332]|nr:hypothetical protein FO519_008695 [Halicephalobus sp. NKZ332]